MQNDQAPQRRRWDPTDGAFIDELLIWPSVVYVFGLFQPDRLVGLAVALWAGVYFLAIPFVPRRVALRSPPGDPLRAAAVLAAGAFPLALYIPLWRELTTRNALVVAFPILVVWCGAAYYMALRETPPVLTPARRAFVLGGGALIYGAIALVGLGGALITLFLLLWGLPPPTILIGCALIIGVGLGLGGLSGWAALRMWAARTAPLA